MRDGGLPADPRARARRGGECPGAPIKRQRIAVDKPGGVENLESGKRAGRPADARPRPAIGSVASRIVLFVFVATFATATLVSWVSIESSAGALRGMIDRLYPLSLTHAAMRLDPWIQNIRIQLEHSVHQCGDESFEPSPDALAALDGMALYDESGAVLRSWGRVPDGADAARASTERVASLEPEPGHFALAVATHPSMDGHVLVGIASLERIVPMFASELPTPETLIALVDGAGRILVQAGRPPGDVPIRVLALERLHAHGVLREASVNGVHSIGAAQPVALLDWHVAILTPFDAAYSSELAAVKQIFLIDLGIILLFSFIAYRVASRLMGPIGSLSESARRVAEGEYGVQIPRVHTRDEIGMLSRTLHEMVDEQKRQREEIERANRRLKDRNASLEQANEVLNQLSITDGLTKLHNHRFFQDHLTREIRRVARTGEPLSILLLDLDDFKRLNDRHGHAAGDEILARIAQILMFGVRGNDLCARYGGEEFVVLAPNTEVEGARTLAEKLRTAISESSFIVDDSMRPLHVTVSIGVARYAGDRKRFFQKADQALYVAKAQGKDCVVVHADDEGEARSRS